MEMTAKTSKMMVTGRQILHMIYANFKVNEEAGALYDISDLVAVRLKNDGSLEHFLISWDSVIGGMRKEPPAEIVEVLFYQQLKSNSSVLKEEMAHYDRALIGDPDRTYEFLRRTVERYIDRRR